MRGLLLGVALLASTGLVAAQTISQSRVAASGQTIIIWQSATLNADCNSVGPTRYTLTGAPSHGKMTVRKTRINTAYPADNPRSVCNTRKADGEEVTYTSIAGYHGPDAVEFETINPNGTKRSVHIDIAVR